MFYVIFFIAIVVIFIAIIVIFIAIFFIFFVFFLLISYKIFVEIFVIFNTLIFFDRVIIVRNNRFALSSDSTLIFVLLCLLLAVAGSLLGFCYNLLSNCFTFNC